jgi:hypothetical protein
MNEAPSIHYGAFAVCGDFVCDSSGHIVGTLPAHKMDAGDPAANLGFATFGQSLVAVCFAPPRRQQSHVGGVQDLRKETG